MDYVQLLMIGQAGRWTQTSSATPLQPKKWNACFWIMFNLWWLAEWSKRRMVTEMQKKGPLSHHKMKCSVLDYAQLLMIIQAIGVTKFDWNVKKGPPSHHKMKCSFLDYIQLLMIIQVIGVTKFDWNVKKGPQVIIRWNAHFWITFNFWLLAEQSKQWKLTEMWQKVP